MKPQNQSKLLRISKSIYYFFKKVFTFLTTRIEQKVDLKKREFLLENKLDMNEQEINETRYKVVMSYTIPVFILIVLILFVGRTVLVK